MTAIDNSDISTVVNSDTDNLHATCSSSSTDHAVIILASGLSQRLGTSKQLLTYQGQSLLQIMLTTALATHPKTVVVVVPKVDTANTITSSLKGEINRVVDSYDLQSDKIQIVENDRPQSGMGQSLYLGIERLKQLHIHPKKNNSPSSFQRVILMGIDQILLDTSHLNTLLAIDNEVVTSGYAKDYKDLQQDSVRTFHQTQEPIIGLPIAISFNQLIEWQSQLSGDAGLRHLLRALPVDKRATVNNLKLSFDIDTPQQRQFAVEQGWLDP